MKVTRHYHSHYFCLILNLLRRYLLGSVSEIFHSQARNVKSVPSLLDSGFRLWPLSLWPLNPFYLLTHVLLCCTTNKLKSALSHYDNLRKFMRISFEFADRLFSRQCATSHEETAALSITSYQTITSSIKKYPEGGSGAPQQIACYETEGPQLVFAEAVGGHLWAANMNETRF